MKEIADRRAAKESKRADEYPYIHDGAELTPRLQVPAEKKVLTESDVTLSLDALTEQSLNHYCSGTHYTIQFSRIPCV